MAIPIPIIDSVMRIGETLINRFFPDPAQAAQATMELERMRQTGQLAELAAETELAKGQISVNLEEAKSVNVFIAGWRPFIGWVCGGAFAFQFVLFPLLTGMFGLEIPPLDTGELVTILLGLLGLGAMRTKEKLNYVS